MSAALDTRANQILDVPVDDPLLREVLAGGRAKAKDGGLKLALPRAVLEDGGKRQVRFELVDDAAVARPPSPVVWLQAARAISLTATLTPCIAVLLYGLAAGFSVRPLVAACAIVGALVLQLSVNLWNDVEDHARLIDMPGTFGGAGVIQKGWLSARQVKRVAVACLVAGLALGVPALVLEPVPLVVIGALAALGTMGYSGKPFGLKYHALGDVTVLALCGPALTLGFSYAAFGQIDVVMVALGLFFGLAAVGILHVNNWQDAAADKKNGAVTVAVLLGPAASKVYLVLLYAAALAAWAYAWSTTQLSIVALVAPALALIPLAMLLRAVITAKDPTAPRLAMVRVQAAQVHLLLGVTLCVGLGVALALR